MAKSNNEIALEVLCGKWGSGNTRKTKLKKAGYDYDAIQKIVNERMTKKTVAAVAQEVLDGKWGSGNTRKTALQTCGYSYDAVQEKVNEMLNPGTSTYTGTLPTTVLKKTNAEVIADAIKFAKWITSDNRFGYGRKGGSEYKGTKEYSITHSGGCHFCGSNDTKISKAKKAGLSNPEEWEYTFVCNTFTHACYAHAGVPSMLKSRGHAWWLGSYRKSKYWTELDKPAKVADLKAGDVCASDTHFFVYLGNGKAAEATSLGNAAKNKTYWSNSIRIFDFTTARYKRVKYIFRFIGTVNTAALIKYGEVSNRVTQWQAFLDWYYNGKVGSADGCFGDNTLKWTKQFQEDAIGKGQGDGIIGPLTLQAAAKVRK